MSEPAAYAFVLFFGSQIAYSDELSMTCLGLMCIVIGFDSWRDWHRK